MAFKTFVAPTGDHVDRFGQATYCIRTNKIAHICDV
jgi:hypothetical protein